MWYAVVHTKVYDVNNVLFCNQDVGKAIEAYDRFFINGVNISEGKVTIMTSDNYLRIGPYNNSQLYKCKTLSEVEIKTSKQLPVLKRIPQIWI